MATPGAQIIGTCLDSLQTTNPLHLAYHQVNRERGRLPGQLRLRSRWTNVASLWFDYLFVPSEELATIAEGSGWRLTDRRAGPASYLAVVRLER
ncbi:MAG: hypothetical protein ACE5MI_02285 [Acidimicrobiia bacterium]